MESRASWIIHRSGGEARDKKGADRRRRLVALGIALHCVFRVYVDRNYTTPLHEIYIDTQTHYILASYY